MRRCLPTEVPDNIRGWRLLSSTTLPKYSLTSNGRIVSAFCIDHGGESAQSPSPGAYTATCSAT